ncbi:hypothetical protein COV16_05950 [Candidatus Woesearchaeota archaeon CG10_big_fil_rev_8_21_14_0_10_34_8]|nr:MAG: hypothetical protein COV16_05950 [Candidatus Woesearchaeota archaeon CG10_big_fil_rev_8_21_14_0_10_34_8]
MAIKKQLNKIKENWLIVVLLVVLLVVFSPGLSLIQNSAGSLYKTNVAYMADYEEMAYARDSSYYGSDDFAPEVETRIITKTARLSTEVERGTFQDTASLVKSIVDSSDAYLLNEDVNDYGTDRKSYYSASYQIKVDSKKYDSVIAQLKELGELVSFNENTDDITGEYTDLEIEIETEKAKLARYQEMYDEAKEVSDKIDLSDRIFYQERRIKYMEDSLENMDQRVTYSTIYFSMSEKRSEYADVMFVKLSELVDSLVNSLNSLITLIFVVLPWVVTLLIIWFVVRLFRKKK